LVTLGTVSLTNLTCKHAASRVKCYLFCSYWRCNCHCGREAYRIIWIPC